MKRLVTTFLSSFFIAGCISAPNMGDYVTDEWCAGPHRVTVAINETATMVGCNNGGGYHILEEGRVAKQWLQWTEVHSIQDDATCRSYGLTYQDDQYFECRVLLTQVRASNQQAQMARSQALMSASLALLNQSSAPPQTGAVRIQTTCYQQGYYVHCN